MVVVDKLNEGLYLGSSLNFLSAHSLGNLQRISLNTCDEGVGELLVL
jgi:hypothetical protein